MWKNIYIKNPRLHKNIQLLKRSGSEFLHVWENCSTQQLWNINKPLADFRKSCCITQTPPYCTRIMFYSNGFHTFLVPFLPSIPLPITIKTYKNGIYWTKLTKKLTSSAPGAVSALQGQFRVLHMERESGRNVTASFLFCLFGVNEHQRIVTCHKTSLLNICSKAGFVTSQWRVHIFPFVLHSLDLWMWS